MKKLFEDKKSYMFDLPVAILKVDHSYQKPLNNRHARNIAKNFNPIGVNQIHVSLREDGDYYVFDGQHRLEAYKILGKEMISAIIYEGLTIEEEAMGYDLYNTIKTQTALDKEKALIVAKDEGALKRKEIVESLGLEIDYYNEAHPHKIKAVGAMKRVFEKGEPEDLKDILYILKESYGTTSKAYQATIINGLFEFIKQYRLKYEMDWLINRLKRFGLNELMTEHFTFQRAYNSTKAEAIKLTIVKFYNYNKQKDNRLN